MTREQIKRLRELAKEPLLPFESDRILLNSIANEAENPSYNCFKCGFKHRRNECSVADNDEDYG